MCVVQGGDNSVERVLTVAVLHLLAADGPYAAAVHDLLNASDVWAAYRDQRHDLFLPAGDSSKVLSDPCLPESNAISDTKVSDVRAANARNGSDSCLLQMRPSKSILQRIAAPVVRHGC